VRRCAVDWEVFVTRVENAQVCTATYFSLEIPRRLLQTPIPEWVSARLQPPTWKCNLVLRWLMRVGLFNPNQRKWGRVGYIVFNLLLYDRISGIWRAVLPHPDWMIGHYNIHCRCTLPIWYGLRICNLIFRRAKT